MKKLFFFAIVIAFGLVACNKSDVALENVQKFDKEGYIPIAKVGNNGKIEHLFLQKDVQEAFKKETSFDVKRSDGEEFTDVELLYVDIYDEKFTDAGSEVALRYKIQYKGTEGLFREGSIEFSILKENNIYYVSTTTPQKTRAGGTITCTTNCDLGEFSGCNTAKTSDGTWYCTTMGCSSASGKYHCTKTDTSPKTLSSQLTVANYVSTAAFAYRY